MINVALHTFGCRVNIFDTASIKTAAGPLPIKFVDSADINLDSQIDALIINSCTVTQNADNECLRLIRKFNRQHPQAKVCVLGCFAQMSADLIRKQEGVAYVSGSARKEDVLHFLSDEFLLPNNKPLGKLDEKCDEKFADQKPELVQFEDTTRAFLKIQDGCNRHCTYCIIAKARGPSVELPMPTIIEQVKQAQKQGIKEVILSGIHLGDMSNYENVLQQILKNTSIERIRMGSLDPTHISTSLLSLMREEPRIMPHLHISLQHLSSRMLKRMARWYSGELAFEVLHQIKAFLPQAFVGMDYIVGFNDETDEDFDVAYKRLQQAPWTKLHVFPYSIRVGASASRLPRALEVKPHVLAARKGLLNDLSNSRYIQSIKEQVGSRSQVLWEQQVKVQEQLVWQGLTSNYFQVFAANASVNTFQGSVEAVKISDFQAETQKLWARLE